MDTGIKFSDVLKNKNFFFLWLGKGVSQFADSLNQMASLALITLIAPGSISEIVKFLVVVNLPGLLISPLAGVFVDRWNRKKIMLVSNIIQGLLILLILLLSHSLPNLLPFYVIIFLIYVSIAFLQPALISSVPVLVSREELLVANSLATGITMMSLVSGAVLGNMLVAKVGISRGFYLDGLLYFISAIILFLMAGAIFQKDSQQNITTKAPVSGIGQIFRELSEGMKTILVLKFVHYAVKSIILLMSGGGIFYVLLVIFIKINLITLGLIYASIGLGLVAGTLIIGQIGQNIPKEKIILKGLISACLIILFFAMLIPLKESLPAGLFFSILIFISLCLGTAVGPVLVSINTFIHEQVPQQLQGRVFSIQRSLTLLTFIISTLIIGVMTTATAKNFVVILATTAIIIAILSYWNYRTLNKIA